MRRRNGENDGRRMRGRSLTIGEAGEQERPYLRPLPAFEYDCCQVVMARLTPYSQVVFDTNRYWVPVDRARRDVTVKAYPFRVDLFDREELLKAYHPEDRSWSCLERDLPFLLPVSLTECQVFRVIQGVSDLGVGHILG